jgi:hypothetical protein
MVQKQAFERWQLLALERSFASGCCGVMCAMWLPPQHQQHASAITGRVCRNSTVLYSGPVWFYYYEGVVTGQSDTTCRQAAGPFIRGVWTKNSEVPIKQ